MDEARRVGPYVVLEQVGVGRHGTVHRARDEERAGRVVTVKLLDDPVSAAALAAYRAAVERVAARAHPCLLPAEAVVDDGRVALVRAHVPGGSIADAAARASMPPAQLLAIGAGAAGALAACHAAGVVHGGLTADDLLLAPGDVPHLVDVGLAALVGEDPASPREDVQALASILRGAADPDASLPADAITALDTAAAGMLDAAELRDALATIEVPEPPTATPELDLEAVLAEPPSQRSRLPRWALVVALALVGVAAVAFTRRWAAAEVPADSQPAASSRSSGPSPPPATTTTWEVRRAPSVCEGVARPSADTGAAVVVADVDGRGCGLPLVLDDGDQRVVTLPAEAGRLAGRYAVARDGERVLFGDWNGDGSETPAVVTEEGLVFVYERFGRVTARPAGVRLPPGQAATVVTNGTRDRVTCGPAPTGTGGSAGPCTGP